MEVYHAHVCMYVLFLESWTTGHKAVGTSSSLILPVPFSSCGAELTSCQMHPSTLSSTLQRSCSTTSGGQKGRLPVACRSGCHHERQAQRERERKVITSSQPAWPMRTDLCAHLGLCRVVVRPWLTAFGLCSISMNA